MPSGPPTPSPPETIRSASLFDTAVWPNARFEADRFEQNGAAGFKAHGRLTLRDVTRDVVLPFTLEVVEHPENSEAFQATAVGEMAVDRLDYGVGQGVWQDTSVVANEVIIRIEIVAMRSKN